MNHECVEQTWTPGNGWGCCDLHSIGISILAVVLKIITEKVSVIWSTSAGYFSIAVLWRPDSKKGTVL